MSAVDAGRLEAELSADHRRSVVGEKFDVLNFIREYEEAESRVVIIIDAQKQGTGKSTAALTLMYRYYSWKRPDLTHEQVCDLVIQRMFFGELTGLAELYNRVPETEPAMFLWEEASVGALNLDFNTAEAKDARKLDDVIRDDVKHLIINLPMKGDLSTGFRSKVDLHFHMMKAFRSDPAGPWSMARVYGRRYHPTKGDLYSPTRLHFLRIPWCPAELWARYRPRKSAFKQGLKEDVYGRSLEAQRERAPKGRSVTASELLPLIEEHFAEVSSGKATANVAMVRQKAAAWFVGEGVVVSKSAAEAAVVELNRDITNRRANAGRVASTIPSKPRRVDTVAREPAEPVNAIERRAAQDDEERERAEFAKGQRYGP